MSAIDLLDELAALDVRLSAADGSLIVDAHDGVLTADLLQTLKENKADLMILTTEIFLIG